MSISLMSTAWKIVGISQTQKLVLLSLADNANDEGPCFPSFSHTAKRTCLSERAIRDAIRSLEKLELVKSIPRVGTSNSYMIALNCTTLVAHPTIKGAFTPAAGAAPAGGAAPPTPAGGAVVLAETPAGGAAPPAGGAAKPPLNRKNMSSSKRQNIVIPDWLDRESWEMWDSHRARAKGWTPEARTLAIRSLTQLREQGFDPKAVIEQSILRGWNGLFPISKESANAIRQPKHTNFEERKYGQTDISTIGWMPN